MQREPTRDFISAKFLLAAKPGETSSYGAHVVKKYPAKVARGAYKPRMANRGDAPTTSHAANYTGRIVGKSQHDTVRSLAARGY